MKKLLTILCLVLLSSYSYSQEVIPEDETVTRRGLVYHQSSTEPFTGVVELFYEYGQLKERENYKDGKLRWGSEELPELPQNPSKSPCFTICPSLTAIEFFTKCAKNKGF